MLSKWKSLKRWQKWVVVLVCLAAIGKVSEITGFAPKTDSKSVKTVQTSTSSKAKTSKSSSSQESTKSESSSSDKPKDITEGQMGSFIEYFKQDLTDKGLDISTYGFYNRDTVLYMTVPNDYNTMTKPNYRNLLMACLPKNMKRSMFGLQSIM